MATGIKLWGFSADGKQYSNQNPNSLKTRMRSFYAQPSQKSVNWVVDSCVTAQSKGGINDGPCVRLEIRDRFNGPSEKVFMKQNIMVSDGSWRRQWRATEGLKVRDGDNADPHTPHLWPNNTFDKLVFFVKPPADLPPISSITGAAAKKSTWEFMTHIKTTACIHEPETDHTSTNLQESTQTGDKQEWTTPNGTGVKRTGQGHLYHRYKYMQPGVWNQVIVDWVPQFQRESWSTYQPTVEHMQYPYAAYEGVGMAADNYFDCLTDIYPNQIVRDSSVLQDIQTLPSIWYHSDFMLYTDDNQNDTAAVQKIASLTGAYDASKGANGEFGISFCNTNPAWVNEHGGDVFYDMEIKYRLNESIHVQGWNHAGALLAPLGDCHLGADTVTDGIVPHTRSDYTVTHYQTQNLVPGATGPGNFMYIGVKASTDPDTVFREICIPLNDGEMPPHLAGIT